MVRSHPIPALGVPEVSAQPVLPLPPVSDSGHLENAGLKDSILPLTNARPQEACSFPPNWPRPHASHRVLALAPAIWTKAGWTSF